jgi:SAM-dependent methyltransferase
MNDKPHLGGSYPQGDSNTIMVDVWGWSLVQHEVKSVLDCGCGFGHALQWFSSVGLCQIKGIEGDPECIKGSLVPGHVIEHDFTTGPAPIAQPFDLCWCAEFVEHVEERYIPNYMAAIQQCRRAIITHAEPGQAGHHHVNCKGDSYWVAQFAKYGFVHIESETQMLRRTDRWRAGWGRRSLQSFVRS